MALLPNAVQAAALGQDAPPTPRPPLTSAAEKPLLRNGAPVEMDLVKPTPVMLGADDLASPVISVWHGDGDGFGQNGRPSPFVNVLGNVQPVGAITSLTYALNGGAAQTLNLGPYAGEPDEGGARRLYDPGDFNIEIPYSALNNGTNSIRIQATQSNGTTAEKTVTINVAKGTTWPLPAVINWDEATNVNELVQVVDGRWTIEGSSAVGPSVRSIQYGYDRLVGLGDLNWTDYEVTVPMVVNAISAASPAYSTPSNGPGVGLILRWPGHFQVTTEAPYNGWTGLGALGWFHYLQINSQTSTAMQLLTTRDGFDVQESAAQSLGTNQPHYFKMQVVTSSGRPTYRFKAWPMEQAEPSGWGLQKTLSANAPAGGSLLLVAHHVDVSFGQVRVTPINYRAALTISSTDGGTAAATPAQADYAFLDSVTVASAPLPGYAFSEWNISVTKATGEVTHYTRTDNPLTFDLEGDTAITPVFEGPTLGGVFELLISTMGNGRVIKTPDQLMYGDGQTVQLAAQPEAGWRFVEWQGAVTGSTPNVNLTMEATTGVTATFAPYFYTITTTYVGNGSITADSPGPYAYGETVRLTAQPAEGWRFSSWSGDLPAGADAALPTLALMVQADAALTATFVPLPVTTYVLERWIEPDPAAGAIIVTPDQAAYSPHETVQLQAAPGPGWAFSGWAGDVQGADPVHLLVMDGDRRIGARFTRRYYALTVDVVGDGRGIVTVDGLPVTNPREVIDAMLFGQEVTLRASAALDGSRFAGWSGDLPSGADPFAPTLTLTIQGDSAITATFLPETTYALLRMVEPVAGGVINVTPEQAEYAAGAMVQFNAVAQPGWTFVGWSGALSGTENPAELEIAGDTQVIARFTELPEPSTKGNVYLPLITRPQPAR